MGELVVREAFRLRARPLAQRRLPSPPSRAGRPVHRGALTGRNLDEKVVKEIENSLEVLPEPVDPEKPKG